MILNSFGPISQSMFLLILLVPFISSHVSSCYCFQFHLCCFRSSFELLCLSLQDKIELREGSWLEPLKGMEGKLAGLVSNPPYIPSKEISGLQAEVGKHEPRVALDGGADGMNALLHLCDGADLMLKSGGFFAFEVWLFFLLESFIIISVCFLLRFCLVLSHE